MLLREKYFVKCQDIFHDKHYAHCNENEKRQWIVGFLDCYGHEVSREMINYVMERLEEGGWSNELHQIDYSITQWEIREMEEDEEDDYEYIVPTSHNTKTWRHVS